MAQGGGVEGGRVADDEHGEAGRGEEGGHRHPPQGGLVVQVAGLEQVVVIWFYGTSTQISELLEN